ncbi:Na(+)-translocating NADH-quinone reductase subunit D [Anaerohalosphaera lusitana]|uniref:Na(+)-translocating NADH-quinone reductase subunit D n=1 Tax=Anaerohalosphaera lusitana TaxID=1936003 RepID=A0A1U9NHF6_9BACT|nr:electron transport complex subunit RsxE [Anaerohalosphaera lusitana]AQT67362.1 Na(+)-translocating NADH-quinone reductase subunit D [Anaerohalosphaera lusitana]
MANDTNTKMKVFSAGFWRENPVLILLLGMCPTLAVTTGVNASLTMGLTVIFVLTCANIVVSLMRNLLKPHIRILMFTLTISTFVTIADLVLKAYLPDMSDKLGPYIPLIIVNCLIICRAEACASKSPIGTSIIDALGMGLGFTATLVALGAIRELFGTGKLMGFEILHTTANGGWYTPWAGMIMPVGAFVTLGLMLAGVNLVNRKLESKK